MTQQTVNFLPEDYVEKRAAARSAVLVVGMFVLELALIVGGYWYLRQRPLNEVDAQTLQVDQERTTKKQVMDDYRQMCDQRSTMQAKAALMAQLMERVKRSDLLTRIHAALGRDAKLTVVELKTKELPNQHVANKLDEAKGIISGAYKVELPATETTVEVMGLAPSHEHVATFLDKLSKVDLITGAQPVFSEDFKVGEANYRRFKVTMKINPNADTRLNDAHAAAVEEAPASKNPGT